jgi:phage baseplate assembly protein V
VTLSPPRCVVRYGDPETDEDCETPPIRWLALRAGKTRHWSPPSTGEEVVLLCPDGQIGSGGLLGLNNDTAPRRAPTPNWSHTKTAPDRLRPVTHALTALLEGATATPEAPAA